MARTTAQLVQLVTARAGDVDPMDQLEAVHELGQLVERQRGAAVMACRADNYSWSEIGDVLGMSRQAAHQAFRSVDVARSIAERHPEAFR